MCCIDCVLVCYQSKITIKLDLWNVMYLQSSNSLRQTTPVDQFNTSPIVPLPTCQHYTSSDMQARLSKGKDVLPCAAFSVAVHLSESLYHLTCLSYDFRTTLMASDTWRNLRGGYLLRPSAPQPGPGQGAAHATLF